MGGVAEFKAYEQHQGGLLPAFVGDALDPADPVFFADDVVEGLLERRRRRRPGAPGELSAGPGAG